MNKISVYFIGAGPGDPELLTIKAKKIIDNADLIIYAGSLVNPDIFWQVKNDAVIYDSSRMTLEEVMDLMIAAAGRGDTVARVHTGDPSIYGAIREQIDILEDKGISCQVIPGVSSFTAAAAALKREFTTYRSLTDCYSYPYLRQDYSAGFRGSGSTSQASGINGALFVCSRY